MNQEMERAAKAAAVRQSGNREFGFVMAVACLVFALVSAWKLRGFPRPLWPALSAAFFLIALLAPALLTPLNRAWTLLGRLLHRFVSPLVLGALYFGFFAPFGLLFRTVKGDPLRLRLDPKAESYWIKRDPATQPGQGMANQF